MIVLFVVTHFCKRNCKRNCKRKSHYSFCNLLYFTLLGLPPIVCTISFAATNSANKRETLERSFSGNFNSSRASALVIVSMESRYLRMASFCLAFSCFLDFTYSIFSLVSFRLLTWRIYESPEVFPVVSMNSKA